MKINPADLKKHITFLLTFFCLSFLCSAQQHLEDSLNKVIAEYKDEAEVARAYNSLAYEYSRRDLVKSRAYLNTAITIGKKIGNYKRLTSSYSQLVYLLHDTGKPDSAEYYIGQVKDLYDKANESEKNAIGSNYYTVAALYYKRTGAYQKAIPFFEKAIELLIKIKYRESTAGQTFNLGNTYLSLGNYRKATEQHIKSLRIFEEIGNKRGMSFCYQSLSNSFGQLKQYDQALAYANRSIKIKTSLNDRKGIGSAESNLGDIYLGLGDLDRSLQHFMNSVNISREVKSLPDEQGNLQNIAKVYKAKKEYRRAIEYLNQSKLLAKQLKDSSSLAAIETELIALQNNANATAASESKLRLNLELFEKRGDLNRQASGYKNMTDFYIANKEFDKALEYSNKYHQAIDSIENNDLQLQVQKMEEMYNVEKKEKEITLLKKDQELSQAKLQKQKVFQYGAALLFGLALLSGFLLFNRYKLRQQMKELELRNRIAADLHDEVGSSLSSIHMLSQMASQKADETVHKDILHRMSNNAKETMDKMGDIVWMIKPGETEASSLKQRMERFAWEISSSKNIELSMQLDELEKTKLSMEQRKNTWLVFKEAVNNAVKYSGTEKIGINSAASNKTLTLEIKDHGKGFDTRLVKMGNGLNNMYKRAEDLGGQLQVHSIPGEGTSIKLQVPV
jgi:two-component system, NarL family, sensor histidine kinase UhpB